MRKPIYFGTLFQYDFYFPHIFSQGIRRFYKLFKSFQTKIFLEIFLHINIQNENGDTTEVCSYPVNVTKKYEKNETNLIKLM